MLSHRIAAVLDEARRSQKISQEKLGQAIGVSQSQMSSFLRAEKTLDVDQLQALCDALGLALRAVVNQATDQ